MVAPPVPIAVLSPMDPAMLEMVATAGVSDDQVTLVVKSWMELSL